MLSTAIAQLDRQLRTVLSPNWIGESIRLLSKSIHNVLFIMTPARAQRYPRSLRLRLREGILNKAPGKLTN